jgi:hypothetical protein
MFEEWMMYALPHISSGPLRNIYRFDRSLEGIDIKAEHKLIEEKKSQLSREMRRRVEYAWELRYKEVK